jgi:hypothetical protein
MAYLIVGNVFGPIRFLLPVCRFCWFLYTFNIHLYMHIFCRIFLSNYWWQESDIWSQASYRGTYMKLVTKYQISAINSCWEKCDEKWAYMFNVYKNQQSRQTGSRNPMGYTILWVAFLDPSDSYFLFADLVGFYTHWTYMHIFLSNYWWQKSDIWSQASYKGSSIKSFEPDMKYWQVELTWRFHPKF